VKKFTALRLPEDLDRELDLYCGSRHIKSKSDLIRTAIRHYIEPDVKDETLRLIGIRDMQIKNTDKRSYHILLRSYTVKHGIRCKI
jgi:metal-responsive CopG/Arc/MetJ family transcriptional regulator